MLHKLQHVFSWQLLYMLYFYLFVMCIFVRVAFCLVPFRPGFLANIKLYITLHTAYWDGHMRTIKLPKTVTWQRTCQKSTRYLLIKSTVNAQPPHHHATCNVLCVCAYLHIRAQVRRITFKPCNDWVHAAKRVSGVRNVTNNDNNNTVFRRRRITGSSNIATQTNQYLYLVK